MDILYNDEIPVDAWEEFLQQNSHATPFQSYEFYKLFNSVPGLSAQAIAVCNGDEIVALTVITLQKEPGIKAYFSRRGIIYGGPLLNHEFPEALDTLLSVINLQIVNKVIYIETRNFSNYKIFHNYFINKKWEFIPYINLTINLKKKELNEILAGMKYNRRRQIQLSIENGAKYKECTTESELIVLYEILLNFYKNNIKLPLPEYSFFKVLWQNNLAKVFIVIHNNKIIGGSFCPVLKGRAIYTMYYCGLRYYNKKIFPTHLAILAAIEYGLNNRLQFLDFMGAGKKDVKYGVRKYKQEFGAESNEYGRYRFISKPILFKLGQFVLDVKRRN